MHGVLGLEEKEQGLYLGCFSLRHSCTIASTDSLHGVRTCFSNSTHAVTYSYKISGLITKEIEQGWRQTSLSLIVCMMAMALASHGLSDRTVE